MFKKLIFLFFALLFTQNAFSWGFFDGYEKKYKTQYGLNKVLEDGVIYFSVREEGTQGKPVTVATKNDAMKMELENALNGENRINDVYAPAIQKAFNSWFAQTENAIKKANRTEEFSDIYPILRKGVSTKKVAYTTNNNVIDFTFTTLEAIQNIVGSEANGYINWGTKKQVYLPSPYTDAHNFGDINALKTYISHEVLFFLEHEIGHYYGLADQYKDFGDIHSVYKTTDRMKRGISVMASSGNPNLSCDDIDGFINLLDLTLSKTRGWSDRAENGWASFCNGKVIPGSGGAYYADTFYKMARPVNSLEGNVSVASTTTQKSTNSTTKVNNTNNTNNKPSANSKIKPFTFYSSQHKYEFTYNKANLMDTKKDEKYSYRYSYNKKDGVPTVKVSVAGNEFYAISKNAGTWDLPVGYKINEERPNTSHYIKLSGNQCNIVNYVPFSDKKSYSISYRDGKLQPEYVYSFPFGEQILELHKYETLGHPVCQVKTQKGTEVIKLIGSTFDKIEGMLGVNKNSYRIDDLIRAEGKSEKEIIDRLKTECRKTLHHSITNNTKELCSYFKKVDDYFNK